MPRRIKILVADSDLDQLSKIYLRLLHKGYSVEGTDDALELLPVLQRFKPHLIILSATLPSMTAVIYHEIRMKKVPVLLLVKKGQTETYGLKKYELIEEPFDIAKIEIKIREMLNILT
jgi:DNA-binding response OmpR family regulator